MTLSSAISLLTSRGFSVIPQTPDFEREDTWACYMRRVGHTDTPTWDGAKSTHEYALIISKDDEILETVYECYIAPKNTRRPKGRAVYRKKGDQVDPYSDQQYKGFYPIYATILRGADIETL